MGLTTIGSSPLKAAAAPITHSFLLQEKTLYEIPIGRKCPTTIVFPGKLETLEGVGVTKGDAKAPVRFSHVEGRPYFTVKATMEQAEGTLNAVYRGKVYALKFVESTTPFRKVTFHERPATVYGTGTAEGRHRQRTITPKVLLSLLDQAKVYPLLKDSHPEVTENITHVQPHTINDYGSFQILLEEVFCFESEDTLVFRVRFQNKTDETLYYAPQSLAACVSNEHYSASLVDASGIMPPGEESVGYFCITGKPDGGRANLSLNNRFQIAVHTVAPEVLLKEW